MMGAGVMGEGREGDELQRAGEEDRHAAEGVPMGGGQPLRC
jgi:hypothetical protein